MRTDIFGFSLSKCLYFMFVFAFLLTVNPVLCQMSEAVREEQHAIGIGRLLQKLFFIFLTCLHHRFTQQLSFRLLILKNKSFAWQPFCYMVCNLRINCHFIILKG